MGQYWTIWNLTKNQSLYPSSFGSLLKLVEIAYTFPGPVGALVVMLLPGGPWAGDRIVFSGDYDEQEVCCARFLISPPKDGRGSGCSLSCYQSTL
jgi:hypothetical protein